MVETCLDGGRMLAGVGRKEWWGSRRGGQDGFCMVRDENVLTEKCVFLANWHICLVGNIILKNVKQNYTLQAV